MIREGARSVSSALLWTKNQEKVLNTHLSHFSPSEQIIYVWCPPEFAPGTLSEAIAQSGDQYCFFSVSLARANVFFKALFIGHDEGGLKFKMPEEVYKVQRRKDMRFQIPDGHLLRIDFEDPIEPGKVLKKKVHDISAKGLSFLVDYDEEHNYIVGMELKDVCFTLRNRQIKVDAEIRHIQQLPNKNKLYGVKLGLQFTKVESTDTQFISDYVMEESRKYLARFM